MAPRANGPKPHQFRNLTFTDHRPKFLANIDAALRGSKADDPESRPGPRRLGHDDQLEETEVLDPSRPAIPIRPRERNLQDDGDDDGPQIVEEKDLAGMGRLSDEDEEPDEDSPEVVVLKERKHLSKEEFEAEKIRLRLHPNTPSSLPSSSRPTIKPSLKFSSNDKPSTSSIGKRKSSDLAPGTHPDADDGWTDLVKRTKGEKKVLVSTIKEEREQAEKSSISKKQRKLDLKAKNKKAKNLMSFS